MTVQHRVGLSKSPDGKKAAESIEHHHARAIPPRCAAPHVSRAVSAVEQDGAREAVASQDGARVELGRRRHPPTRIAPHHGRDRHSPDKYQSQDGIDTGEEEGKREHGPGATAETALDGLESRPAAGHDDERMMHSNANDCETTQVAALAGVRLLNLFKIKGPGPGLGVLV